MEKFAVDIDKVLDDFELDEDENESVNQYEKLQLEFCPDGGSSHTSSAMAMRHNIGLSAFGGWSEPLQPSQNRGTVAGPTPPWCASLDTETQQPPGTRSPPDGQNDDNQQSATCSQHLSSRPFHQPLTLQPQPHSSSRISGACGQAGLPQHPGTTSALWPVMASSAVNTYTLPTLPDLSSEQTVKGYRFDNADLTDIPHSSRPLGHVTSGQENNDSRENSELKDVMPDRIQPVRDLDVITSRPLDVIPSCRPHDDVVVSGHEGKHPDIIDVWLSGTCSNLPSQGQGECANSNGTLGEVMSEAKGDLSEGNSSGAEHPNQRLLPDLMSMNNIDTCSEGQSGAGEYSEPAVVMENTLAHLNPNDPAIVVESQAHCRIPEVVNVHQMAENDRLEAVACTASSSGPHLPEEPSGSVNDIPLHKGESSGACSNNLVPSCDNLATSNETGVSKPGELESGISCYSRLPDVSSVNPVPISFCKDDNVDDAYLEAELAELEEDQFRLQGAYSGSLASSVGVDGEDLEKLPVSQDVGIVGGLDLIDGVSSTNPVPIENSESEKKVALASDSVSKIQKYAMEDSDTHEPSLPDKYDLETHDSAEFPQCEVSNVEEVVCQPQNKMVSCGLEESQVSENLASGSQGISVSETHTVRSNDGDGEDNLSNASTGTDTMSSSSTLTDGDLGSEQRAQPSSTNVPDSPSRVMPGTLVTAVYDDDSGSGREDESSAIVGAEGTGDSSSSSRTQEETGNLVGQVAPFWIPDDDAPNCQECGHKFTVIRRRHHCRACGRVLCAPCCHHKAPLPYMDYKEARVCGPCLHLIQLDQNYDRDGDVADGQKNQSDSLRKPPDPNNPMEYCSRVPPHQQAAAVATAPPPTVMVPVGVLKREGSSSSSSRNRGNKQVIFSDGIRPGGDLTELDGSGEMLPPYRRSGRVARRVDRPSSGGSDGGRCPGGLLRSLPPDRCLIPPGAGLPPVVVKAPTTGEYVFEDHSDSSKLEVQMRGSGSPVVFAVHKNLTVLVKVVKLECCVGVEVWNFATRGLCTVGQEEMVILMEVAPGESHPPRDIFAFFHTVYQQANQGNLVTEMGHTIFTEPEGFLGSREHGGFLYIRPTFQCLRNLVLPPSPYIFAVLIQKWETPWAKVFPLRLMLRMGAEFRYYPCPLVSTRNRKPVFCEIGHTIMNLLVDFRNYAYTVPTIEGFVIHMEDKKTSLLFPKNRYEQVTKALSNSNDHVLALGANFSPQADSHLVTIENDDGHYSTQAINIHNRPRKVTGASFIVFNGALKTNSGLSAKSSIVEDGLMIQIPADMMTKLREALRNMKEFSIPCGPVTADQPDEVVVITWSSDDKNFNVGIKSAVDEREMDGIPSAKIHSGIDYVNNAHMIRWTEVFILQGEANNSNDINLSRISELLARAFCVALTPHLADLHASGYSHLGLRSTIHQDNVGYEAGSNGSRLPAPCMNDLDTELIPVIHRAAANITDEAVILELVFHIMEQ